MVHTFIGIAFTFGLILSVFAIGSTPTPAAPVSTPKLLTPAELATTLDWLLTVTTESVATVPDNEQELTDDIEHFADMLHTLTVPSFTETFDVDYMFIQPLPMPESVLAPAPVVTAEEVLADGEWSWLDDVIVTSEVAEAQPVEVVAPATPLTVVQMRKYLTKQGIPGAARFNRERCLAAMANLEQA